MKTSYVMRILRDRRGNALVEGALIMPVLLALVLGGYEVARAVAIDLDLEQAAQTATSIALAKPPTSSVDTAHIEAAARAAADGHAETIRVDAYRECNGQRMSSVTSICSSDYQEAYYVSVEVNGTYRPTITLPEIPASISLYGDSVVRVQ